MHDCMVIPIGDPSVFHVPPQELLTRYVPNMGVHRPAVLRLGWLLFVVLKAKLLPSFPDLVR